jgi:hypothetical protein
LCASHAAAEANKWKLQAAEIAMKPAKQEAQKYYSQDETLGVASINGQKDRQDFQAVSPYQ